MSTDKKDISKIVNGVTVYWTGEGVAYTGSKPTTGMVSLVANKLTALVSGTNELIDDNQTDEEVFNLIRDLIGEAMAEFEDAQVLTGTGTSPQFPGIFTAGTSVPTSAITEASPTYAELVALKNKVPMKYRKSSSAKICWVCNQDFYSKIESMVDLEGRPLLKESMKRDSDETLLLGYPIEVVPSAPVDKIAFGNFNYYLLGDRKSLSFEFGYATGGFETDVQSLKANERIAGKVAFVDAFAISA
jgi:HK97 family phage major capsid protein